MERDLLYRFFSGKVSAEEVLKIKEWADASPENYRLLLKERKLFDALQLLRPAEEDFAGNAKRIQRSKFPPPYRVIGLIKEVTKLAAVVLLTIGMTMTVYTN